MRIIAYTIMFRPLYTNQHLHYVDHILDKYFHCLFSVHKSSTLTLAVCEDTIDMRYYYTFCNSIYETSCMHNIVEVYEVQHAHLMIAMCSEENNDNNIYGNFF
ncbi:hypothetical protein [Psilogramma increta granulovirus]|uniref:Uncharacterized protein n=1 Tax=Psilogramma increta granulovirus TaxID=2953508 RepID=A0A977TP30_9BBAC|nr:hypothetical protein [Psilogramma increta granulovirus]